VRNSARMCGVVGWKPTYGLVSRRGVFPLDYSLDTVGPLTRTVRDNALVHHPHNRARGSFVEVDGVMQPAPAPRFSRTPASVKGGPPPFGAHTREALAVWGFAAEEIEALHEQGAVGRRA
jgi:Asp-tRNA(Asn)/Glu-tRNA(Gln) amidotransferase A subunit family amidase